MAKKTRIQINAENKQAWLIACDGLSPLRQLTLACKMYDDGLLSMRGLVDCIYDCFRDDAGDEWFSSRDNQRELKELVRIILARQIGD